jgi:hypothetical protein
MRPALAVSVALLIDGALACLLVRRAPAPAATPAAQSAGSSARQPR